MCACAYHWGGCRYHERQGFALGSSSSSSACSFMAAGLWCLCSYPLLAILESGLPWMTPPFEHPCAQVGRPSVPQAFHRHIARMPQKLCPCPLFQLVPSVWRVAGSDGRFCQCMMRGAILQTLARCMNVFVASQLEDTPVTTRKLWLFPAYACSESTLKLARRRVSALEHAYQ